MYKVGQIVVANDNYADELTKGKKYEILEVHPGGSSGYVTIINDQSRAVTCLWGCFEKLVVEIEVDYARQ